MGLPFSKMKLWEGLSTFEQDFRSICSENLETVINLQSLIENRGENVPSTSTPGNSGCAWRLSLLDCTYFFLLIKIPEIHFSLGDVSKTKAEPTDYGQSVTDFASAQAEMATESMAAFAEVAKKVQMETVELMMAAGKEASEEATAAVKKATSEVTTAAKKATAAAK